MSSPHHVSTHHVRRRIVAICISRNGEGRTGGAPIGGTSTSNVTVSALTTGAPTAQDAAIDLLYKERAYWLWLTGHRLGDLRRLVRIYKRGIETVFPTGQLTSPLEGTYGTSTTVTVPFSERNNPNFQGCLDEP
jgi:hypothetical protein